MQSGKITLDLHGMTWYQAQVAVDAALRRARPSVYRLELIHGYHGGTRLRDDLRKTYAGHPKVKRIELSMNPGVTELVLREY